MPILGRPRRAKGPKEGYSRICLEPELADLVRFAAEEENMTVSELVQSCLNLYVQVRQPSWTFTALSEKAKETRQKNIRTFLEKQIDMFPNLPPESTPAEAYPEPKIEQVSNTILRFMRIVSRLSLPLPEIGLAEQAALEEVYATATRTNPHEADRLFERWIETHIQLSGSSQPMDVLMNLHRYVGAH